MRLNDESSGSFNLPKISLGRRFYVILGTLVLIFSFFLFFLILPLFSLVNQVKALQQKVRPVKDALLLYDLDKLDSSIKALEPDFVSINNNASRLKVFSFVPFLGGYLSDAGNLADFASEADVLAVKLLETIKPYGPSLGFKVAGVNVPLAGGQERIVGLAKLAPVMVAELPKYKNDFDSLSQKLSSVDPNRYPQSFAGLTLRSNLNALKDSVTSLSASFDDLTRFFSVLPDALAMNGKKNYLILFQNDKEIRPSGGFLTAYAVFTLDKGRIVATSASDSYFIDIDNKLPIYDPAPEVIKKYLKLTDNKLYFRDANLSPDFKVSMQAVERIWNRSSLVPKVDGIIGLDTQFVQGMMAVLGDINVPGYPKFTKDNVVNELELFSSILGSKEEKRQGRKDLIGILMQQMIQKAFASGGKEYLSLIGAGWQEAVEKHLLFYLHDPETQKLIEDLNFGGRVKDFAGDYLYINDANFAGRKGNLYIKETVTKDVAVDNNKLTTTLTVEYENTGKYDPDLNTGYRDYVRIYVPEGSTLISSSGSQEEVTTGSDLGKTFFAGYMAVDPLKKATFVLKYQTPRSVIKNNIYNLLVQKQPGTDHFHYSVKVDGHSEDFDLLTDKEISIKF
ncbi:MAG: DUF4012 domain-containing protein [Patescibacteria group bacterium]|nr:DUF4012 domain-containing protein [Patescibacteria group bacterium]